MSSWREQYKVHPSADAFPMMSDDELATLGADIKANGLKIPITVDAKGVLLDGRNRIEAMKRAGIDLDSAGIGAQHRWKAHTYTGAPTAFIISVNIHRRHLTKQQQADLIVAAVKAAETARAARKADKYIGRDGGPPDKPRQVGEVSDLVAKGGRGKVDKVKAEAVAVAKDHGISERTVERSIAKAEGKKPLSDHRQDQLHRRNYTKSHPVNAALTMIKRMTPAQRAQFDVDYTLWCERTGHARTTKPNRIGKVIGLIASPNAGERDAAFETANRLLEPLDLELVARGAA